MTANFRILFKLHIDFGSEFCMDFFNLWLNPLKYVLQLHFLST